MRKTALVLATVGALAVGSIGTATPAKGWHGGWGWGPGIAGGLLAGAVIGGIASSAYGWGPGYGYYGGYAPAYYGGYYGPYAYAPAMPTHRLTAIAIAACSGRPMPIMAGHIGTTAGIIAGTIDKPRVSHSDALTSGWHIPPAKKKSRLARGGF